MTYWLGVFTPKSWQEFEKVGAKVSGFPKIRWKTVQTICVGDILVCYMKTYSCWFGALEVVSEAYWDDNNIIWTDATYPCCVPVHPILTLERERGIPAKETLSTLKLFENVGTGRAWGRTLGLGDVPFMLVHGLSY